MPQARGLRSLLLGAAVGLATELPVLDRALAEESFPQIIRTRYEAIDPKAGGNVVIWLELEKLWFGVNPRLSPPVKYVNVTYITPSPGSPPICLIELMPINASQPEYLHIAGLVRLRIIGMALKSSNVP